MTLLIAECASCHDGDIRKAHRLVRLAADTGWNVAKFQFWSDADRLADRRKVDERYRAIYHRYRIPEDWLPRLEATCHEYGLEFMCTTYIPEDIAVVAPYVKRFKVSSFEAGDLSFLIAHERHQKPVIVSTGMMGIHDVTATSNIPAVVLHCVSAYPCPLDSANVSGIRDLYMATRAKPGYSDHTAHELTGALAVAAGAQVIEAHIRLDDTDPDNPDYVVALSPEKAKRYVENVRLAERMIGDGVKRMQDCEKEMAQYRVSQ